MKGIKKCPAATHLQVEIDNKQKCYPHTIELTTSEAKAPNCPGEFAESHTKIVRNSPGVMALKGVTGFLRKTFAYTTFCISKGLQEYGAKELQLQGPSGRIWGGFEMCPKGWKKKDVFFSRESQQQERTVKCIRDVNDTIAKKSWLTWKGGRRTRYKKQNYKKRKSRKYHRK